MTLRQRFLIDKHSTHSAQTLLQSWACRSCKQCFLYQPNYFCDKKKKLGPNSRKVSEKTCLLHAILHKAFYDRRSFYWKHVSSAGFAFWHADRWPIWDQRQAVKSSGSRISPLLQHTFKKTPIREQSTIIWNSHDIYEAMATCQRNMELVRKKSWSVWHKTRVIEYG